MALAQGLDPFGLNVAQHQMGGLVQQFRDDLDLTPAFHGAGAKGAGQRLGCRQVAAFDIERMAPPVLWLDQNEARPPPVMAGRAGPVVVAQDMAAERRALSW